jgi:hypothetical protein
MPFVREDWRQRSAQLHMRPDAGAKRLEGVICAAKPASGGWTVNEGLESTSAGALGGGGGGGGGARREEMACEECVEGAAIVTSNGRS